MNKTVTTSTVQPLVEVQSIRLKADEELRLKAEKKLATVMKERDDCHADLQAAEAELVYFAGFTSEQWSYFFANGEKAPTDFFLPAAVAVKTAK